MNEKNWSFTRKLVYKGMLFLFLSFMVGGLVKLARDNVAVVTSENVKYKNLPIYCVETDKKQISLTFDAAWGDEDLDDILATLEEYDAKATFFVTNQFSKYRYYLKQIDADGHAIGIHTTTHRYGDIYKNETAFFNDLNTMGNIIKEEVGYFPKITRFPGGSSNSYSLTKQLVYRVYEKGYQYFDWNVSSGDAAGIKVPATIAANVINGAKGKDSICVLMHDLHTATAQALPAIIDGLRAQGFIFMPLTVDNYGYHHRPY